MSGPRTHRGGRRGFASPRLRGEGSAFGRTSGAKRSGGEGAVQEEAPFRCPGASFVAAPSPSPAAQACRLGRPSPRKRERRDALPVDRAGSATSQLLRHPGLRKRRHVPVQGGGGFDEGGGERGAG